MINSNLTLKAQAFEADQATGRGMEQAFVWHKAAGKSIRFTKPPHEKYSSGGIESVINAVLGSNERYGDSEWLGFEGEDVEAIIDFGETLEFSKVSLRFFKGEGQWIYLPKSVQILYSEDGEQYVEAGKTTSIQGDTKVVTIPVELAAGKRTIPENQGREFW